jgi:hypothetical protein
MRAVVIDDREFQIAAETARWRWAATLAQEATGRALFAFDEFGNERVVPMSSRELYLNRAKACVSAANAVTDPSEQMALMKIAQSFMLADYIGRRQEHWTAHREEHGSSGLSRDS